jgi:hypothetical protein
MQKRKGYARPGRNYFTCPFSVMEDMPDLKSSEFKVLMYILRHTWGFSEYGKPKQISLDEFCKGRKLRGGGRMDRGTGLSTSTVQLCLDSLVEKGHIKKTSFKNGSRSNGYELVMLPEEEYTYRKSVNPLDVVSRKSVSDLPKIGEASKIDTQKKVRTKVLTTPRRQTAAQGERSTPTFSNVGELATKLEYILAINGNLAIRNGNGKVSDVKKSTLEGILLDITASFDAKEIDETLDWLRENFNEQYTPSINSVQDLKQFQRFIFAKRRQENNGRSKSDKLIDEMFPGEK